MEGSLLTAMSELAGEMRAIRHDIHRHPELGFNEWRTSALVAERLRAWGIQVHERIGKTGLVCVLTAGTPDGAIGLRADMDALPINEATGASHASIHRGISHS